MDGLSAFVCSAQAFQYALSVVKSLSELRNALKYGGGYLRDERAGVIHLREIIIQLIPKDKGRLDPGFVSHLDSIGTAVSRLLRLLQQQRRLQIAILLVVRRAEVHDSFALLERKKSTLNLYLTAQNTAAIASFTTSTSYETTASTTMSPHSHSSSEVNFVLYLYSLILTYPRTRHTAPSPPYRSRQATILLKTERSFPPRSAVTHSMLDLGSLPPVSTSNRHRNNSANQVPPVTKPLVMEHNAFLVQSTV